MASSLRLEEPSVLAGQWQATLSTRGEDPQAQKLQDKPSNTCLVELQADKVLGKGADCLGAWLEEVPIGFLFGREVVRLSCVRPASRTPCPDVVASRTHLDSVDDVSAALNADEGVVRLSW